MDEAYYPLQKGLKYQAVLEHFQRQAAGVGRAALVEGASALVGRRKVGTGLKLIDVIDRTKVDESGGSKRNKKDKVAVEVVEPAEAAVSQALSEVGRDSVEELAQRGRAGVKRSSEAASLSRKKIKRARDIFDE